MKIIILAGGSGTRLWPLSRTDKPKQFIKLKGMEKSFFQLTIENSLLMGRMDDIYIVTGRSYLEQIQEQIKELRKELPAGNILLEPEAKNTLPAIYYAVGEIRKKGEDTCVVLASDHIIDEPKVLTDAVSGAIELAARGLVCFGITPDTPETGYGYIKYGEKAPGGFEVAEFKEKPDYETACKYVKEGYLWNSGMFMFHTLMFDEAVKKYNPEVFKAFEAQSTEEKFQQSPSVSIDYGLTEKMDNVYCVPLTMGWNDLGNYQAFYDKYKSKKDINGNIRFNDEIILDGNNNLIYSDGKKITAMISVSDLVVVEQDDALLICHKDQTHKIKDVTDILKQRKDNRV